MSCSFPSSCGQVCNYLRREMRPLDVGHLVGFEGANGGQGLRAGRHKHMPLV